MVAYLILSHTRPRQVLRLADRLLAGDPACRVVIHHDTARTPLTGVGERRVDVLSFQRGIEWGRYAMVQATLDSLMWIAEHIDPDWTVLLSGQDYPIRPVGEIGATLLHSDTDAFIDPGRMISSKRPGIGEARWWHARYFYRWYRPAISLRLPKADSWAQLCVWFSLHQPLLFLWPLPGQLLVGVRRLRTPFNDALRCYAGSQWMALSRLAVTAVTEFGAARPDVVSLYRRSMMPDESLINTILMNSPQVRTRSPHLTYLRFPHASSAHPATLGLEDLPEMLASGRYFARKVEEGPLLDALDRV